MGIDLGIEGAFDGPVVGEAELGPLGVLEIGAFGAGGFAFEEAPAVVDADPPVGADLDFRGSAGGNGGETQQQ